MKTAYVVTGQTGEYSDRGEWLVRAFEAENEARAFCDACTEEANALWATLRNKYDYSKLSGRHKLDPQCQWDYTGTSYFVQSCPFGAP